MLSVWNEFIANDGLDYSKKTKSLNKLHYGQVNLKKIINYGFTHPAPQVYDQLIMKNKNKIAVTFKVPIKLSKITFENDLWLITKILFEIIKSSIQLEKNEHHLGREFILSNQVKYKKYIYVNYFMKYENGKLSVYYPDELNSRKLDITDEYRFLFH